MDTLKNTINIMIVITILVLLTASSMMVFVVAHEAMGLFGKVMLSLFRAS